MISLGKRGRGLDPAVMAWLMTTLQIGPGIGQVHFVVKADSAYYSWLRDDLKMHSSVVHHTVTAAEDAITANRNDVICVYPGAYDEDSEVAYNKDYSHVVGMGGPNVGGDFTLPGVAIYTDNVATPETIDCTADYSQFHNINISNFGNNAACLSAFNLDGYGCFFKNVSFQGKMTAGNDDTVAAASLYIDRLGHFPVFEDCVIGQNQWDLREGTNSGVLRFVGTTTPAPVNGLFKGCRFLSASETAACVMVALPANFCIDRTWTFKDCTFSNFSVNHDVTLNQVFYDAAQNTHNIVMDNCAIYGITEWETSAGMVRATMPTAAALGGVSTPST